MKKFKNIGYVPARKDIEIHDGFKSKVYKGLGFSYVRFDYEDPESYRNGDTLLDLSWQAYEPDNSIPYWSSVGAKVSTEGNKSSDYDLESFDLGVSILKFVFKQYGYQIDREVLSYLPESQAVKDVKHVIGREKHYGSEPSLKFVEPEVLAYVAHKRMGIERVIYDGRQRSYVTIDNVLPANVNVWQAKVGEYPNDIFLAQGLATDVNEAKKVLFNILSEEVDKLNNGERLTWVYKEEDKIRLDGWFTQWVEQDSPVYCTNRTVPDHHSLYMLLNFYEEFVTNI
jgi:hypothetical protein